MSDLDGVSVPNDAGRRNADNDHQNPPAKHLRLILEQRVNPGVTLYGPLTILLAAGALLGAYTLHEDLIGEVGFWDAAHAATIVIAALLFLRWYSFAEQNTWTYGPGRAPHAHWRVWVIPAVNLYGPGQLRDILTASAVPTSLEKPDSYAARLKPFQRWTCLVFQGSWAGLLAAGACLVAAYCIAYARHGEIPYTLFIFDLAFQVFSITGAACLIVLFTMIIRQQRKRNKEAWFLPPPGKWLPLDQQTSAGWTQRRTFRVRRRGWGFWWAWLAVWMLSMAFGSPIQDNDPIGAVAIPLAPVLYILQATPLPLPPLPLSRQDMVGTWHGAAGATVTLRADGTFEAHDLPEDPGSSAWAEAPWSGTGSWAMSSACGLPRPGICLVGPTSWGSAPLETVGSAFSPLLRFSGFGSASDLHK